MGYVSGALILALTLSGLETSADFIDLWYREVILGEIRFAATAYDRVYIQRAPWRRSTEDEQRIAALRAGLCYERLGRPADARLAYDWLRQHCVRDSAPVNLARSRLEEMARSGALPDAVDLGRVARSGEASLLRDALAHEVKIAWREVTRGRQELASLERELEELESEVERARSLRARLETLGAGVFVGSRSLFGTPPGGASDEASATSRSRGLFRGRLEARLRSVLKEGFSFEDVLPAVRDDFCDSALRAVLTRDVATAKRHLEQALALPGTHAAPHDFVRKLDAHQDSPGLMDLARRYLLEERLRQVGELQSEIREKLASAGQKRPDLGVMSVVDIWQMAARARPGLRREAEISHLVREADRLYLALTFGISSREGQRPGRKEPREELRKLLGERELQYRDARGLVRDIVEATTEKLAMEVDTLGQGRPGLVARELQHLLAEGRGFLDADALKECEESIRKVQLLLAWFPDLASNYRAQGSQLQEDLESRLENPSFQEELDRQQ